MANPTLFDRIVSGKPLANVRFDPNPTNGTPGTLASSGTLSHNGKNYVRTTVDAAVTGIIVQGGLTDGQFLIIENTSAYAITFAAAATSNVRNGASTIIPGNQAMAFIWNGVNAYWTSLGPFDVLATGLFGNGTVGAPAISFAADTDTGVYRIGANNLGIAAGGAKVLDIATQAVQYVGDFGSTTQLTQTKSADYTMQVIDSGYVTYVDTDAKTITLPATAAGLTYTFVNAGTNGAVALTISPNAADKIMGAGLTPAVDKDLINTKATAKKGDRVTLVGDGASGWYVTEMTGTWARQA